MSEVASQLPSEYAKDCLCKMEHALGFVITGKQRRKIYQHNYQKQWNRNRDAGRGRRPYTRHKDQASFMRHKSARAYGITGKRFDEMLEEQNGACAICKRQETITRLGKLLPLSIDHDHTTGKIRGLLCGECNRGLGKFKDNPELLIEAAKYLNG